MVILHTADIHFNRRWFQWLLDDAPEHDLLVIAGDILSHESPHSLRAQIRWFKKWLRAYNRPIVLCSGRHDLVWDERDELWTPAYWLRALAAPGVFVDGQRVTFDDCAIQIVAATAHAKGGAADIWVVHAPPAGTPTSLHRSGREGGDYAVALSMQVFEPRWILCGRVHDAGAWSAQEGRTLVLNPGHDASARFPNHIVLDTETGAVCHVRDQLASRVPAEAAPSSSNLEERNIPAAASPVGETAPAVL